MGTTNRTIEAYISSYPEGVQKHLNQMYAALKEAAPEAEETINYGIPTFQLNGKNLVHFAGAKKHIGFYPTPSGIEAFQKELADYKSSKGSVQFPLNKPLPLDLVKKIVQFRVKEILQKPK